MKIIISFVKLFIHRTLTVREHLHLQSANARPVCLQQQEESQVVVVVGSMSRAESSSMRARCTIDYLQGHGGLPRGDLAYLTFDSAKYADEQYSTANSPHGDPSLTVL